MGKYVVRRIFLQGIPVLLGFTFLLYFIITIAPGSPVNHLRGIPNLDPGVLEEQKEQLGLNDAFLVQYVRWLTQVLKGDLGRSFDSARRPVSELIK
ncbi:MAG TPA: hypothetical protein GX528_06400, partial [Firmicutes bacterium]|nr:hypothetical protein [Bacillota bacterium]